MKRVVNSIFISLVSLSSFAQLQDTFVFNEARFLKQVYDFAPAVRNSGLEVAIQNQEWLAAKSVFEPKLIGGYDRKNFDSKTYYNKLDAGVKVNTPIGVKVSGGYADNDGVYLNPESNVPVQGLVYAGIEVPLGAGMFTDAERTLVKQQRLENNAASLLNTLAVNDHLLESGEAYWDWYEGVMLLNLSQEAIVLAQNRLRLVVRKNAIGEAADIDTLEAFINFQNRQAFLLESTVKWEKYKNKVQDYIWMPEMTKDLLAPEVDLDYTVMLPDSFTEREITRLHPLISLLDTDSLINRASLALAREFYKPQVDLAFKLQEDGGTVGNFDYNPQQNNYIGLNVNMPLLLRKQRAKANQSLIKEQIIGNKKQEMIVKILNAQRTYHNNTLNLKETIDLWSVASANYKRMLNAEQMKFTLGESSLFIVNSRELKWIAAREKYIKSYVEYRKSILRYYHSLGILPKMI
jgi:outer membrane protein TolC